MRQLDLPIPGKPLAYFDGPDLTESDQERLANQQERVKALMLDGRWRTLYQIAAAVQGPESSVSAQLRHLRKPRFGGYTVNRRHITGGVYEYQLLDC